MVTFALLVKPPDKHEKFIPLDRRPVAQLLPQAPPEHAQCDRQPGGVAYPHLPGRHLRRIRRIRAADLRAGADLRSLLARAGAAAGLPFGSRQIARKHHPQHHAAGLDGTHDERHADLQPQHRPHHGGQNPRGRVPYPERQPAHRQAAGRPQCGGFGAASPDGGGRRVQPRAFGERPASDARSDRNGNPGRGNHHRAVRAQAGAVRHQHRRRARGTGRLGRRRDGRAEPVDARNRVHHRGTARRQPALRLSQPVAVARHAGPARAPGRGHRHQHRSARRRRRRQNPHV